MSERDSAARARLVVVTGSGRSGTSTVTGALARLGLDVPGPLAPPDERNPKGFYETPWVIERNGRVLESLPVRGNDARPEAGALADAAADDPDLVADLRGWLTERVAGHAQSVVKDPQIFWLHRAWRAAAAQADVDLSFVTMLRHPVEVARSRDTAYLTGKDAEHRRVREISNVAAWCNAAYLTELNTRDARRAFVRYDDLLSDWRRALIPVQPQVGIRLDPAVERPDHHAVDDFIDSSLNRSRAGWDETSVPTALREVAEATWQAVNRLVADPHDPAAVADLETAREQYAVLHAMGVALAADHTQAAVSTAVRDRREEVQRLRGRVARLRGRVEELEQGGQRGPASRWLRRVRGPAR